MDVVIDEWSNSKLAIKEMQEASASLLKNPKLALNTRGRQRAAQLMHEVKNSKKVDVLYRGMGVTDKEAARLMTQTGKKISLPITSASADVDVAREFMTSYQLHHTPQVAVLTEIRGARGFDITELVDARFAHQRETIIMGNFRVVDVTQDGNQMHMILEAF